MIHKIGIDPGFGGFKSAEVQENEIRVCALPSVVGVGETDVGYAGMGLSRRRARKKPLVVEFDGFSYLAGENVHYHGRPVERMDFNRLADGPELRVLFYASLWNILGEGKHEVNLLIGLPVEVLLDKSLASATLRELRGWLVADHEFTINGETIAVSIGRVNAMAQPLGCYFGWGLGTDGKWKRSKDALRQPIGVIDGGFNTLALYAIEDGRPTPRFTGGDTLGMRRAAELIAAAAKLRYGRTLSLHEADALIRTKRPVIHTPNGDQNVSGIVRQSLDTAAASAISFIEGAWGNGRQFSHVLATGGQALAMKNHLLRQYPHAIISSDPVLDNARGFAKYAMRL